MTRFIAGPLGRGGRESSLEVAPGSTWKGLGRREEKAYPPGRLGLVRDKRVTLFREANENMSDFA